MIDNGRKERTTNKVRPKSQPEPTNSTHEEGMDWFCWEQAWYGHRTPNPSHDHNGFYFDVDQTVGWNPRHYPRVQAFSTYRTETLSQKSKRYELHTLGIPHRSLLKLQTIWSILVYSCASRSVLVPRCAEPPGGTAWASGQERKADGRRTEGKLQAIAHMNWYPSMKIDVFLWGKQRLRGSEWKRRGETTRYVKVSFGMNHWKFINVLSYRLIFWRCTGFRTPKRTRSLKGFF